MRQSSLTSKPNERSCPIFLEKLSGFSPPFFFVFVAKDFFSDFLKKFRNFFSMKLTVKIFEIVFNEFSSKKFLIVNFRLLKNFLLLNSLKKFSKIFTVNFVEKKFRNFFRKSEKNFFATKKKGGAQGVKIRVIFPGKSDTTFRWVLTYIPLFTP